MSDKLTKINELLMNQNIAITNLNSRVERITDDISDLRTNPNYNDIYAYIDRQIQQIANDFARKIGTKADSNVVDNLLPKQINDIKENLLNEIQHMKNEVNAKKANKEDISTLHIEKADGNEVRELASALATKVSQYDVNQILNKQLTPIVTSLSALEKVVHLNNEDVLMQSANLKKNELYNATISNNKSIHHEMNPEKTYKMIEDYINTHHLGDVTPVRVDAALAQHTEHLLKEMNSICESNRLEMSILNKEQFEKMKFDLKNSYQQLDDNINNISDISKKTKVGMKQLASNIAKSLSTKVNQKELKSFIDDYMKNKSITNNHVRKTVEFEDEKSTPALHTSNFYDLEKNNIRTETFEIKNHLNSLESSIKHVELISNELKSNITKEINDLKLYTEERFSYVEAANRTEKNNSHLITTNDWRLALGETSINLRREISDKMGREEITKYVRTEIDMLEKKLYVSLLICNIRVT